MASFHNDKEVSNQVGGQQNVHGPIYFAPVSVVNCAHSPKHRLADSSDPDPLAIHDDDILASLAFPQMFDRRGNVEQPHANTCRWILDLEEYKYWRAQPQGLLWIKGKPGTGKSTLMSFLYHRLREQRRVGQGVHLEFFFTARGTDMQRTPLGMLRSLLNQLFHQDPRIRFLVRELYTEKCTSFGRGDRSWEWQRRELEPLLAQAIMTSAQHQQVTIFIDALDEAGEESARETARYFHEINNRIASASATAKICISCRHYPIPSTLRGLEVWVEKHNSNDIAAFVHGRLNLDCQISDDVHYLEQWHELRTDIVRRAGGVFQWVRLIMPLVEKYIYDGESPDDVRQRLQQVPEELGGVYEHILRNVVDRKHRSQSFQLFQWICLAERPLSVTEMRYALAAQDIVQDAVQESVPFSPRVKCYEIHDFVKTDEHMKLRVKTLSGGLAEVVSDHNDRQERVQAIHQSINDFLRTRGLALLALLQNEVSAVPLVPSMAFNQAEIIGQCEASLYWSCLCYLATEDVKVNDRRFMYSDHVQEERKKVVSSWPLIDYAAINLFVHGEKATGYRGQNVSRQIQLLEQIIPNWVDVYRAFSKDRRKAPHSNTTILHAAASANMTDIVEHLIRDNFDVNIQDGDGYTALHLATLRGHQSVTDILFHARASIHMKTKQQQTPLVLAAGNGHVKLVQWLLCRGAELKETTEELGKALQVAVNNGNAIIVKILLGAGADANAQGEYYRTALHRALYTASYQGHEKVVHMLLDAGAGVNAQERGYGTALYAASDQGHEKVAHMLLAREADVNFQGGGYGTALQAASFGGHEKVVQMLLDAKADVNVQGGEYGTALQAASYWGREEVVRMLLGAGADANAQGRYGTALQAASYWGREEVVRILLDAGADVNAQGGEYGTALQAASYWGSEKVVQGLLDAGADVNAQGGEYGTALQAASYQGHEEVVQILLGAGADVNTQGGECGTALQAASYRGRKEVVQTLLNAGAYVNAQGGEYGTALQAASCWRRERVVQMLLNAGADVNGQGGRYGTAIQAASYRGYEEVVKMLLDAKADVNAQGGEYGTALKAASHEGQEKVVRMLLDAGAGVHAQEVKYDQAMQALSYGTHQKVASWFLKFVVLLTVVIALFFVTRYTRWEAYL